MSIDDRVKIREDFLSEDEISLLEELKSIGGL